MNHLQVIEEATACIRQFQASPTGCSAQDIALAEGISIERCQTLLAQLEHAHLIERTSTSREQFCLAQPVTALDVVNAVWAELKTATVHVLYASSASQRLADTWIHGNWAQG